MQRFAQMLRTNLGRAGHEVRLITPPVSAGRLSVLGHGASKWLRHVDKLLLFPSILRQEARWADIVHICDHSNAVYVRHVMERPNLVTCHDVLEIQGASGTIPKHPVRWSGRRLQRMILSGLRQARRIVCVSDATTDGLMRLGGFDNERVSRVYNGPNARFAPMEEAEAVRHLTHLGIDGPAPFVFHVGGDQWYKNRAGVVRIFASLKRRWCDPRLKLVMAGKPLPRQIRELAASKGLGDSLIELPGVSNEQLNALYSMAQLFLFPSLEEGFGWPIIEAQLCGCPVVTSSRAPMDEVAGNGAVYIDPADVEDAASRVMDALPAMRDLRQLGFRNVQRFNAAAMAESYAELYDRAISERRRGSARRREFRPSTEPIPD